MSEQILTPEMLDSLTITITPQMTFIIGIVAYVIQQAKLFPYVSKLTPYFPLISMGLGILLSWVWALPNPVPTGVIVGMAASTGYKAFNPTKPEVQK